MVLSEFEQLDLGWNHSKTYPRGMTNLDWFPALPWQPLRPGFAVKVIRGCTSDDETRAVLLRLEPGTVIPRHRHEGEVHALNLAGSRELDTGEVIGPGGYVYEPPGNVDSWKAVGDVPLVVFVTVRGAIVYLDDAGATIAATTNTGATAAYARFVAEHAP
jgi:quercetin dioxygenase-like cupin family protein